MGFQMPSEFYRQQHEDLLRAAFEQASRLDLNQAQDQLQMEQLLKEAHEELLEVQLKLHEVQEANPFDTRRMA